MKKLTFKDVAPERILDYDAMSKIRGGMDEYGEGTGTCGIKYKYSWDSDYTILCNIRRDQVEAAAAAMIQAGEPYWWCCDSCATSSYCGSGSDGY